MQHSTLNATVAQLRGGLDTGTELRAAHRSSWSSCVRVGLYKNEIWETSEKISISEILTVVTVLLESPPKRAYGPRGPKDMGSDRQGHIDWDKHPRARVSGRWNPLI